MKNRKRYLRYKSRLRRINKYGIFYYDEGECPKCGNNNFLFFYYKYDARCCLACDTWLENACNDISCPFCANRPPTPWSAFFHENEVNVNSGKKDFFISNFAHKYSGELRHKVRRQKIESIKER